MAVHKDIDAMPRSLALTLMIGVVLGGSFWATLIAIVVR